ncbi:MAG TPA: threonine--tRNA ligase [Candidatus Paceibacterota bacterium]|nr:threonine--tRNA ligase [Candidatus Paceibacterota bacterium]
MDQKLEQKRHTLAHLLALAVRKEFPYALPTIGPAIENGFYYDFDFSGGAVPTEADLARIEERMRKYLPSWTAFTHKTVTPDEAREYFGRNAYKKEIVNELEYAGEKITLYTVGEGESEFTDLCRGGHAEAPASDIDPASFKLASIAGAYWRGDEKNAMLTRIYGYAFDTKEELEKYLADLEEAKRRDHRILGEKLDLFYFNEEIGKGLPIWLPRGNIIKEEIEKWAKETEAKWGYQRVTTPILTKGDLFLTSGHLPLYMDAMYAPIQIEDENYYIKPMNCPLHHKTYAARPKSYRDLPLRLAEYGWCHRYEDSGSLFGLMRVRGMQMNDAHIYVAKEDAIEEFVRVIKLHEYYYKVLGIHEYKMELALRDPNKMTKYHGNEQDWAEAELMTTEAMERSGVPFTIVHEGAAFYGPKMDFQIRSSIGREFTASTNQLDLYAGKKFGLEYVDKDGSRKTPVIIHRAPLGTHERFIAFLIEHFGGDFPLWLSPEQVRVIPVSDAHAPYAKKLVEELTAIGIRASVDDSNESVGKRIRNAKLYKLPYFAVVGDKEVAAKSVTLESRKGETAEMTLSNLGNRLLTEIETKAL